ncbi:hypothetical protein HPB47_022717 [Ixodes persulcatus]|uniref:Uncharacterized protein n=1 Tax=Ixodes persulcatus TaxID=34615 RepID=A0AC60Q8X5_IXOPE|nr:hypothetical protein HPB47_022717 [Ixodes persulcatus]
MRHSHLIPSIHFRSKSSSGILTYSHIVYTYRCSFALYFALLFASQLFVMYNNFTTAESTNYSLKDASRLRELLITTGRTEFFGSTYCKTFNAVVLFKIILHGYAVSTMVIILAIVAILIISVLLFKNKSKGTDTNKILAPGPKGLPIIGYMPFIGPTPHVKYKELSKIYGPIVRIKMGSTDVLVLHDVQSIKEGLNKDEVLARPPYFLLKRMGMDGVITMNGQPWLDNRRFCLHVLRDLGFGSKSMEQHIKEEVAQLCDALQSWDGKPNDITDIITSSISNNITALLFGERFHYDDPRRHFLDTRLVKFALNASTVSALDFLPIVWKLVSYIPSSKIRIAQEELKDLHDFIRQVWERSKALNADVNKDFIGAYLNKINEKNGGNASFNPQTLTGNALNLFGAGTLSVKASMLWHLLNCARDPEGVQRKLQQEVDEVVGRVRAPVWEDRENMPYTMAVIWEMLRWRTVAPLGIIRDMPFYRNKRSSASRARERRWKSTLPTRTLVHSSTINPSENILFRVRSQ